MKKLIAVILIVMLLLCCAACGKNVPDIEDEQHGTNEPMGKEENPGKETGTTEVTPPVEEQNPTDPGEEAKEPEGAKEPEEDEERRRLPRSQKTNSSRTPASSRGRPRPAPRMGTQRLRTGKSMSTINGWAGLKTTVAKAVEEQPFGMDPASFPATRSALCNSKDNRIPGEQAVAVMRLLFYISK